MDDKQVGSSRNATPTLNWSWNGTPIIISEVFPPIPTNRYDYCAYLDGYEPGCLTGEGATPAIAAVELVQWLWEMEASI